MDKEYLTCVEAAELMGIKKATIYNWIVAGKLPCYADTFPKKIRREDVEKLMEIVKQKSWDEEENEYVSEPKGDPKILAEEELKEWAKKNGSELLRERIANNYPWLDLAKEERELKQVNASKDSIFKIFNESGIFKKFKLLSNTILDLSDIYVPIECPLGVQELRRLSEFKKTIPNKVNNANISLCQDKEYMQKTYIICKINFAVDESTLWVSYIFEI